MTSVRTLETLLDGLGYRTELRRRDVYAPGSNQAFDLVAFTRVAPQDIRTAAIAAGTSSDMPLDRALDAARQMAAPIVLLVDAEVISMYRIGVDPLNDALIEEFDASRPEQWELAMFRRALDPNTLQAAKSGLRQLSLFPVDARAQPLPRRCAPARRRPRAVDRLAHLPAGIGVRPRVRVG